MTYGIAEFALDMETFLRANLNNKITALNSSYNDSLVLKTVDTNAYFFQGLDDAAANYDPFILHMCENPEVLDKAGGGILESYKYTIVLALQMDNEVQQQGFVLARYNRALKELIKGNYSKIGTSKKIEITGLETAGFASINGTQKLRVTAVTLEVTFGS